MIYAVIELEVAEKWVLEQVCDMQTWIGSMLCDHMCVMLTEWR